MDRENISFYERCIEVWGKDAQIKMCIEEMSELIKELCKNWRQDKAGTPEQIEHICEEIADVQNMIDQMQLIFGEERVEQYREYKIERTKRKLDKESKINGIKEKRL